MTKKARALHLLQEFSIPLLAGIAVAIIWANASPDSYHHFLEDSVGYSVLGHKVNFHFIINDVFMVLFFGIAAVEITTAVQPGGALSPVSKAINPLLGTLGGVAGPIVAFFILCKLIPLGELTAVEGVTMETILNGWGIPTATDIALAWLVARVIFGGNHPAVTYLLLLAVADDAIGLAIIAIFYPDPSSPVEPLWMTLTIVGMLFAYLFREKKVNCMWIYVVVCGGLSWFGLIQAHLHPALALVFIVPFIPSGPSCKQKCLFDKIPEDHSPLVEFEHRFKTIVDIGLFGFGLANAGVVLAGVNNLTWIIFLSLVIGKTVGITTMGYLGHLCGASLPRKVGFTNLLVVGVIASLGLTVALFVSGEAYSQNRMLENAAKMGALLSVGAGLLAYGAARMFQVEKQHPVCASSDTVAEFADD